MSMTMHRGAGPKPVDAPPRPRPRPLSHLVGYAHLDPVWLWGWQEGYAENRATFRSAIDRLDEYPEFVFTTTSVQFLAWVAEADPPLFDAIAARVADGRLHLAGGWWIEPDCNIPSGESLARHGLYGQRWLAEQFGVVATVATNPDTFGHPAGLPQILVGAGLDGYVFTRPERNELDLQTRGFLWSGTDGSSVVAYRTHGYSSDRGDVEAHLHACLDDADDDASLMVWYGVGNHGGGPTRANLDSLRRLAATTRRTDLVCSSPAAFLATIDRRGLPRVTGDLTHHSRGCYSAHAGIKRWNRTAESALLSAERWSVVAHHECGLAYPAAELAHAWQLLLVNQFHDTLAGTAIESAYDDARNQLGEALSIASRVTNAACGRLAATADIPAEDDMQPIVVFNPHAWPVNGVIEHEVGGWARRMNLRDSAGRAVPMQWGASETTLVEGRYRAVFQATLPPLGFSVFRLGLGACVTPAPDEPGEHVLDNGVVAARIDPSTGGLASLRRCGSPELSAPGAHAVAVDDDSDTWGHGVVAFDGAQTPFEVESVSRIEHGPVRSVLRVTSRLGESTLTEDWSLGSNDAYLDVDITLDWREHARLCKLRFPTALRQAIVTAESAYAAVERPIGSGEQPMQRWVDVSSPAGGVAIVNDGKYAFDTVAGHAGADLGITVARGVVYAWHDPARLDPNVRYRWMDQGEQRFRLRIVPHDGDWAAAGVPRRAAELNQRPHVRSDTYHPGRLGAHATFAAVTGDTTTEAVVVKRAEDGSGDVVRLAETAGRPTSVELTACGRCVPVSLGAFKIVTLLLPDDLTLPPVVVDLCEWSPGDRPPGQCLPTFAPIGHAGSR